MTESHVFDTYAKTSKGRIMHFDVVLDEKNPEKARQFAQEWLARIGHHDATVSQENCMFCHSLVVPPPIREQINQQGYAIYKLEGCPK